MPFQYACLRFWRCKRRTAIIISIFFLIFLIVFYSLTLIQLFKIKREEINSSVQSTISLNCNNDYETILSDILILSHLKGVIGCNASISGNIIDDFGNNITLIGNTDIFFNSLLTEKNINLTEGFIPTDKNKGAIVSRSYKETLSDKGINNVCGIMIVGMYDFVKNELPINLVLSDYQTAENILHETDSNRSFKIWLSHDSYPEKMASLIANSGLKGNYDISIDSDAIKEAALISIKNIIFACNIILYIVFISSIIFTIACIIMQLVTFNIDVGVLLSLGQSKSKIWLCFLNEMFFNFILGIITGAIFAFFSQEKMQSIILFKMSLASKNNISFFATLLESIPYLIFISFILILSSLIIFVVMKKSSIKHFFS